LTAAANIVLSTGTKSITFVGQAGINRVAMPLEVGSGIRVRVVSENAYLLTEGEANADHATGI